jgi:hypothetical protein
MPAAAGKLGVNLASLPVWLQAVDAFLLLFFFVYVVGAYRSWRQAWRPARPAASQGGEEGGALRDDAVSASSEGGQEVGTLRGEVVTAHTVRTAVASVQQSSERAMGAQSVGTFITVSVAGAAILLAASGVLLGIEPNRQTVPPRVFTELSLGIVWLVLSLACGIVAASFVLNHLHHADSVAKHPLVETCAAAQLCALLFGGISFMISVFLV